MADNKYAQLNIVKRNLNDLKPHPQNPRMHPEKQMEHLDRSIDKFSFRKGSIVYQKSTGFLLAGHAIRERLISKGFAEADVIEWDVDDATAKQFMIADNKTADDSEWDTKQLEELIKELDSLSDVDLRDTGFDLKELDELFPELFSHKEETFDIDAALEETTEDEGEPITKPGDIWLCGKHRVMCGDSTKKEDVARLMGRVNIDVIFTDPPYGISIQNKDGALGHSNPIKHPKQKYDTLSTELKRQMTAKKYPMLQGDNKPFDPSHILEMDAPIIIIWGGNYFADKLPASPGWLVWYKRCHQWKRLSFADCELAWTNMNTPARVYQQVWSGLIRSGDGKAERIGGFARGRLHPTQKPVGVTAEILKDFSDEGCVVFDGYLGSGTTLIAAEKTNRILYGMEIESYYCDVICKRYYEFTDDIPTLESTGESFPMQ